MIKTALESIRFYIDEPDTTGGGRLSDSFIIRHILSKAVANVFGRLVHGTSIPILVRHQVDITADQEYYTLPPCIQEVWALGIESTRGELQEEIIPRGNFNPYGPGWRIEGSMLAVSPWPGESRTFHIWYVPSPEFMMHYGETASINADGTQVTLAQSSDSNFLGGLDSRTNAYAGAELRVLTTAQGWEQRTVESYDATTRVATLRRPLSSSYFSDTNVAYEVCLPGFVSLWNAISLEACMQVAVNRKVTEVKWRMLQQLRSEAMKTIQDRLHTFQNRMPAAWETDTLDRPSTVIETLRSPTLRHT